MSNMKPSIIERIQMAKLHGHLNTSVDQALLRAWQCDTRDTRIASLIEQRLHAFESALATGRIPPFKASQLHEGDLVLGQDLHGHWVRIWLRWLLAGLLIVANTGSGKSNLLLSLITQVAALKCNFWMGEFYKRQLRHLRPLLARFGITLIVLRPQDWKWNLLQAHVNDPQMHLNLFVDLLARICDLSIRARNILTQGCYELYRRYGIWAGNRTSWPTIFELLHWIQTAPDLNSLARDTIVSRLISIILDFSPRVLAYRRGWSPTDLANFNIDFEMSAASETVKKLLPSLLIFPVFQREIEKGVVNAPPKLVLAFDDSQRLFEASLCSDGTIAPLTWCM